MTIFKEYTDDYYRVELTDGSCTHMYENELTDYLQVNRDKVAFYWVIDIRFDLIEGQQESECQEVEVPLDKLMAA